MISRISCLILMLALIPSCAKRNRMEAPQRQNASLSVESGSDSYQVTRDEYDDNFESRYGLLHLKASNDPFTGRIVVIDSGLNGDYVSSDESWKAGRKHGKSSKWFENGVKEFERNYREGRWHGLVTRWWPNGQKMYVTAYSNGVMHEKQATWRSDGTSGDSPSPIENASVPSARAGSDALPSVDLPLKNSDASASEFPASFDASSGPSDDTLTGAEGGVIPQSQWTDSEFSDPLPEPDAPLPPLSEPEGAFPPLSDSEPDAPLPPLSEPEGAFPPLSDSEPDAPLPPLSEPEGAFPPLSDSEPDAPLPPFEDSAPEAGVADPGDLPLLPESDSEVGLPPLPEDSPSVAPLPDLPGEENGGFDDLPPLPPLP